MTNFIALLYTTLKKKHTIDFGKWHKTLGTAIICISFENYAAYASRMKLKIVMHEMKTYAKCQVLPAKEVLVHNLYISSFSYVLGTSCTY